MTAIEPPVPERSAYAVSVRALCAFTAKAGDLDLRFTPSPTAQQGQAGHRIVASRRPASHLCEVPLEGDFEGLAVRGRADGYDASALRLEEVKTCRGDADRVPANHRALHWAQAETYAHLQCHQAALSDLTVAIVYFDITTQAEHPIERRLDAADLEASFADRCRRFMRWAASEQAHRVARNQALEGLTFPHGDFRAGQRDLAEAVYRGAREGRCVLAQAPTGIGKTVGTLFPALKAIANLGLDKVFYLTAKTSGRRLALDGLKTIAAGRALPLRVIELVARDSACEHPGKACHGEACPLARGFYDRLAAARQEAVAALFLDRERLREIALAHAVCPYYLGQELVKWCDVVVGDYNHYFDASALLFGLTRSEEWRVVVLVDEAHNLVERGRAMYSAELDHHDLLTAARDAPAPVRRALRALDRSWQALTADQTAPYQVHPEPPTAFKARLDVAIAAIAEHQADTPHQVEPPTLQLFFALGNFARLIESFGTHSLFDSTAPSDPQRSDGLLCVRNVVPASHLAPRFAAAQAVVLFSATLAPTAFYRAMLGLPDDTVAVDIGSPFAAAQLRVRTASAISTRFADRGASVGPIAALIAAQFEASPGNYIAFFSSFDYLERVADELCRLAAAIPAWRQTARMTQSEQAAFLDRFTVDGQGVGFAVLGGRFAEGVDLPGRRLVGAFVATLGLPQVNPVNEHMRRLMDREFGKGYEYTYLFPGLRKVVQAAGRVIRTTSDQGTLHLIDDRYTHERVRALLPDWWEAA